MTGTHDDDGERPTGAALRPDPTAVEMVLAEEQLEVGRAVRVSGRAVLRKYVVTETITQTVEVRREEVRLDVEPLARTDTEADGARAFRDRVVEVVLHREVPVVQMRVEPVERVRLHIDTVVDQAPVAADLRRERLAVETPDA